MNLEDKLEQYEGQLMTPRELVDAFGEPYLYLNQFCGFIKGEYRILATKNPDSGLYRVSEVYKP